MHTGIDRTAVDEAIRPQDDLFGHVNGGWCARAQIPQDRSRYGAFDMLREAAEKDVRDIIVDAADGKVPADAPKGVAAQVAGLYESFMDAERIEQLGATPLAPEFAAVDAVQTPADLMALLGRWAREGVPGFIAPFVNTDAGNPDRYVMYLEQDGIGLPDEAYYHEPEHEEVRQAYVPHVERMLTLAGIDDAPAAAQRVWELERRIAQGHWDKVASRDAVKSYNLLDRAGLDELTPGMDWDAYLQAMGAPATAFAEVVVRQPDHLRSVTTLLAEVDIATWRDWLRWNVVHATAPLLSAALVEENFAFYGQTLSGTPQLRERWKRAVGFVEGSVGEAVGQLYVARHFPPRAKELMVDLVENLREAYRRSLSTLDWMGPQTRDQALAKLESFRPKIGYPDTWRDYSALQVDAGDLVGNARRASAFETDRELAKLGGPVDRDEWFMTPQTVNAYYNPGMNEIVFPAAILQPPFFDLDADMAANYGAIGAVIGHEMGHGFDDQGSQYDGTGALRNWWTDDDRAAFQTKADALIEQFNQLESRDAPGKKVNGALTVGENIGDLTGLRIGHLAYRISLGGTEAPVIDGTGGDQRFFMGWAQAWRGKAREAEASRLLAIDPHSPMDIRCNAVRNLTEFHDAFGVQQGDGMWLAPDQRVCIF